MEYKDQMASPLVADNFRLIVAPLLPARFYNKKVSRPAALSRAVLTGTVFLLRTSIPLEMLR